MSPGGQLGCWAHAPTHVTNKKMVYMIRINDNVRGVPIKVDELKVSSACCC